MTAVAASTWFPTDASNQEWAHLSTKAPQVVATMRRYLVQLTTFLAPRSVEAADLPIRLGRLAAPLGLLVPELGRDGEATPAFRAESNAPTSTTSAPRSSTPSPSSSPR